MMPWIVPRGIARWMSRLACTAPKLLLMPISSIAGSAMRTFPSEIFYRLVKAVACRRSPFQRQASALLSTKAHTIVNFERERRTGRRDDHAGRPHNDARDPLRRAGE